MSRDATPRKYRPPIRLILVVMLLIAFATPLVGLFFLRVIENQLVRRTEAELIGQSAALAGSFASEIRRAGIEKVWLGSDAKGAFRDSLTDPYLPLPPTIDLAVDRIHPPRPAPEQALSPPASGYLIVGQTMAPIVDATKRRTLAGIYLLDSQGRIVYGPDDEIGMSLYHVEEVQEALDGEFASTLRTRLRKIPPPWIYSFTKGASLRVFTAFPVVVDGKAAGVVYASRSPRHILQMMAAESEKLYLAGVVMALALAGFGYIASRAITNPFLLRTRIHPDDRARIEKQTVRLLADGQVTLEYRFLDGAGNYRWVHDEQRLTRSPDGTPSEIAGTLTDISQRKQAEQRLELIQAAVERVADGVVITARDRDTGRQSIVYANPAFAQVSGYPMDDILGGEPRMMYGAETRREDIDALRRRIEQTQPFEIELRLHRADGQPFHAELTFTPLLDNAGRPINWVTVVRDITQRKRDTELAQLHQSELAHVTRLSTMGEMASGLAHELNQPLAAIANYGQGALRRIETGNAKAQAIEPAIRHIVTQANRAGEIIRRLRDFVTKRETHRSTASINQLVAGVINLAARDITEQGAAVETDYATDLPELLVDTIQIEQVVLNLIRNAAEAMSTTPIGQPRPIQINTRLQHPYVVVEVTDRGHGLTAKQLDHLFDPFFTTKDEGMGMGLTISQSIIESHGGRLRARNNPDGDGATLWITLPIHPSGTD